MRHSSSPRVAGPGTVRDLPDEPPAGGEREARDGPSSPYSVSEAPASALVGRQRVLADALDELSDLDEAQRVVTPSPSSVARRRTRRAPGAPAAHPPRTRVTLTPRSAQ